MLRLVFVGQQDEMVRTVGITGADDAGGPLTARRGAWRACGRAAEGRPLRRFRRPGRNLARRAQLIITILRPNTG